MCIVYLKCKIFLRGRAPYPCFCIGQSFAEAGVRGWETSCKEMGMVVNALKFMCERGTLYILTWQRLVWWNTITVIFILCSTYFM